MHREQPDDQGVDGVPVDEVAEQVLVARRQVVDRVGEHRSQFRHGVSAADDVDQPTGRDLHRFDGHDLA